MPSNLSWRGKPKSSQSQSLNVNFLYSKHGYNMQRQADTKAFKHMMVKIGNIKMHFWIDWNCFLCIFCCPVFMQSWVQNWPLIEFQLLSWTCNVQNQIHIGILSNRFGNLVKCFLQFRKLSRKICRWLSFTLWPCLGFETEIWVFRQNHKWKTWKHKTHLICIPVCWVQRR